MDAKAEEINCFFKPVSPVSEGLPTITQNSPITPKPIHPVLPIKGTVDISTQTELDGITVSKAVETVIILDKALGEEEADLILKSTHLLNIKDITD